MIDDPPTLVELVEAVHATRAAYDRARSVADQAWQIARVAVRELVEAEAAHRAAVARYAAERVQAT